MSYTPKPIDTSSVQLPEELADLTELLSENTHEIWAQQRLKDGWTLGPERDDKAMTHPCLILYDQLPESEKEYDRNTSMEAIKAILHLGYRIIPPTQDQMGAQDEVHRILDRLEDKSLDLRNLSEIWRGRSPEIWRRVPEIYRSLGHRILGIGEPLLAFDVISEGLEVWTTDLRLRQLNGLTLARGGSPYKANQIARELQAEGNQDDDTLGLLGRTHKDLWEKENQEQEKAAQLEQAFDAYYTSYQNTGSGYTGINAATLALIKGDLETAHRIGQHVYQISLEEAKGMEPDYWTQATLGEVLLILNQPEQAREHYTRAGELGKGNFANLNSTRRNARLLLDALGEDPHWLDDCFALPKIIVFTGHPLLPEGEVDCRFPVHLETELKVRIANQLNQLDADIGIASAAAGADILFLEAMLERGGEIDVILPYAVEHFVQTSVDVDRNSEWKNRFERILNRAGRVIMANDYPAQDNRVLLEFTSLIVDGTAILRAQEYDTPLVSLAVWDGQEHGNLGETPDMISRWKNTGRDVEIIDVPANISIQPESVSILENTSHFPHEIRVMFFADVVGYSKLSEVEVAQFIQQFVGYLAQEMEKYPYKPLTRNTWGDAFYFVFSSVEDAAHFALTQRDLIRDTDWAARGLPPDINLRIALHTGPVYRFTDPMIQQLNFSGSHVSRAARIEPITPPGQVYASEHFASLIVANNITDITCDYVGLLQLAKNYGTFRMYHVRRSHEPE